MNDKSPQAPSVWSRRLTYGFNVGVLILAALVIVILLNWISVRQVKQHPAFTRFDLTSTREYSLSPQTRQVLSHLDQDVDIVTLFLTGSDINPKTAENIRYFSDLLDEYQRWGRGRIKISHIQPALEVDKFRDLCNQIASRYKDHLAPAQNALQTAKQSLQQISAFSKDQSTAFTHRLPDLQSQPDLQLTKTIQQLSQVLSSLDDQLQLADRISLIDKIDASPLPDYASVKSQATEPIRQFRDNLLAPAVKVFNQRINSDDTPADIKQLLITTRDAFNRQLASIDKTIAALDSVNTSDYDTVRNSIMRANSSIVMTPDRITVIKLGDVYTDSNDADNPDQPDRRAPEQRFRGEESVTSAIISLTLKVKPLIVFVNPSQQPALGPNGIFNFVASQLTNMNFQVREWNPAGRASPFGPAGPTPKPQPAKDQPVVWVLLPQAPPDPRMPYMPQSTQIADTLKSAIKDHQPCFIMLSSNPMSRFGQSDAVADSLKDLGITVDNSVLVMHNLIDQAGRPSPTSQFQLTTWPDTHPIGKALAGQAGILLAPMPISLNPKPDAKAWPLIETPADTWAETDLSNRTPRKDPTEKAGPFTIAAAFSDRNTRLVVMTDPFFSADEFTQYGSRDPLTGRLLHAAFPANSEFFTDSIYWLASHDELIATGARSQDIRRYQPISNAGIITVWSIVLAGLPFFCLVAGGVVWLIRRR